LVVDYSLKNKDIEEEVHAISIDLTNLEGELFNNEIRHKINVALMKSYIEDFFSKEIDKLTKEGKETVEMVPISVNEENKRIEARK